MMMMMKLESRFYFTQNKKH